MIRRSYTAAVARDEEWKGKCATEPYECAWASEAIFFVRLLEHAGGATRVEARVQISPDGMHWCDEGSALEWPSDTETVRFVRVRHFGGYLRLVARLPRGARSRVLIALVLKE